MKHRKPKQQKRMTMNEVVEKLSSHSFRKKQNPTKNEIEKEARQLLKAADRLNRVNQIFQFKSKLLRKAASIFKRKKDSNNQINSFPFLN